MALTGKQRAWAEAYLVTLNKTEASKRAGYKGDYAALGNIGYQNYKKLEIQEYLKERLGEMTLPADEILAGLSQEATSNISAFLDPNSLEIDPKMVHELGHLVKSITQTKYGPKIELYDAQAAKVHLGKVHGLFSDNITVKVEKELDQIIEYLSTKLDNETFQRVINALTDSPESS